MTILHFIVPYYAANDILVPFIPPVLLSQKRKFSWYLTIFLYWNYFFV